MWSEKQTQTKDLLLDTKKYQNIYTSSKMLDSL